MGKEEFLNRLAYLLQDLPEEEAAEALDYYRDYIEEAGPEREEEVLAGFGSPERVASMIRVDLMGGMKEAGEFTEKGYKDGRFDSKAFLSVQNGGAGGHGSEKENRTEREAWTERCERAAGAGPGPEARDSHGFSHKTRENTGTRGREQHSFCGAGRAEKAPKREEPGEKNEDKGGLVKKLLIVAGVILLLPILLKIVFGVTGRAMVLALGLAICLLFLGAATVGLLLGGIVAAVVGAFTLFPSFWTGLMLIGIGLGLFGAGCLLFCCSWLFYGRFLPWLVQWCYNLIKKLVEKFA